MKKKLLSFKNMFISFFKEYTIVLFYIVANFINAILLRLLTSGSFGIRVLFFDFGFVILLSGISFFIKKKYRGIYFILTSLFMIICCCVNAVYYNYYDSYVSISLLATSVFVKDVSSAVYDFAIKWSDWIYFWELIGIIILLKKGFNNFNKVNLKGKQFLLITFISFAIGSCLPPYYSFSRLFKLWNRVSVVNTFGVYVYQIDDFIQSLTPKFSNIFGYDKALLETTEYYKENEYKSVSNDYSSIFEGKNVIAIHAESLQSFVLGLEFNGVEVTPNLNKLVSSSIYFSNFYAQVGVGTSSDTEFTYATSLLPSNTGTVFVNYYDDTFVTMQKLLNDKGYYVFSMHGNVGDFWNRENMHLNMGYDKFYSKSSFVIDEEYGLGLSDESFFRQVIPMIDDIKNSVNTPYYGTLITLTNHTPWHDAYSLSDLDLTKSVNISSSLVTRDYLENTALGRYIKTVNYMDRVLGEFIDKMNSSNLLDDTVLVIYGDHDARLGRNQFNYMYNYDPYTDKLLEEGDSGYVDFNEYEYELSKRVPLIIYTNDMEKGLEVDTPMGMIDVMPTLGNMLNITNKYALGQDIMGINKSDGIVVFKDGSYITDKIYYSAKNSNIYALQNGIIDNDYVNKKCEYADKIIKISNNIITYDLLKDIK